jgi:hypothetical protein
LVGLPGESVNIRYPYVASPDRAKQIREGRERIREGLSPLQVEAIIGVADEIRPLYEPVHKNAERIGTTRWYYLEKKGNSNTDSKCVRVSFDLNERVSQVDHWGFDG